MNRIVNGCTGWKSEHKVDENINKLHPKVFLQMLRHKFKYKNNTSRRPKKNIRESSSGMFIQQKGGNEIC